MAGLNGASVSLGVTNTLPANCEDWPTAEAAAKMLGITRRTFDKFYPQGRIVRYRSRNNTYHYDPQDIDRLLAEKSENDSEVQWLTENPTAALMVQTFQFNQALMARTDSMIQTLIEAQREDNKLLRERCTHLENAHSGLIKAREEALNEAAERNTSAELLRSSEARKNKAVDEIIKLGSVALGARQASKFMGSLTPEQIELAYKLGSEMWTPEQMSIIEHLRKAKPYVEPTESQVENTEPKKV